MITNKFIVDKAHPSPFDERYFETTYWRPIGHGITFRNYKHWSQEVFGAEGCTQRYGDRSGCLMQSVEGLDCIYVPWVAQSRIYKKGEFEISAVLSYPNGLSIIYEYFWEIFQVNGKERLFEDVERFLGEHGEEEMENRIIELLKDK